MTNGIAWNVVVAAVCLVGLGAALAWLGFVLWAALRPRSFVAWFNIVKAENTSPTTDPSGIRKLAIGPGPCHSVLDCDRCTESQRTACRVALQVVARYVPDFRALKARKFVVLSGSAKFTDTWIEQYKNVVLDGNIPYCIAGTFKGRPDYDTIKPTLDARYQEVIRDYADELLVLNVNGYIGPSTLAEIACAVRNQIPVRYLEGNKK